MTVDRDFPDMTPAGMKFTTMAGMVGGGNVTPGFVGHSKYYITSRKFLRADGGIKRLVWMPSRLKEEIMDRLIVRGQRRGGAGPAGHDRRRADRDDGRGDPPVPAKRSSTRR